MTNLFFGKFENNSIVSGFKNQNSPQGLQKGFGVHHRRLFRFFRDDGLVVGKFLIDDPRAQDPVLVFEKKIVVVIAKFDLSLELPIFKTSSNVFRERIYSTGSVPGISASKNV